MVWADLPSIPGACTDPQWTYWGPGGMGTWQSTAWLSPSEVLFGSDLGGIYYGKYEQARDSWVFRNISDGAKNTGNDGNGDLSATIITGIFVFPVPGPFSTARRIFLATPEGVFRSNAFTSFDSDKVDWDTMNVGLGKSTAGNHTHPIQVLAQDPADRGILLAGVGDMISPAIEAPDDERADPAKVYRSTDFGQTWQAVFQTTATPMLTAQVLDIQYSGLDLGKSTRVLVSTTRGLLVSADRGQSFKRAITNLPNGRQGSPNLRDLGYANGKFYVSVWEDRILDTCPPPPPGLVPNPAHGAWVLPGPTTADWNGGPWMSTDDGKTWTQLLQQSTDNATYNHTEFYPYKNCLVDPNNSYGNTTVQFPTMILDPSREDHLFLAGWGDGEYNSLYEHTVDSSNNRKLWPRLSCASGTCAFGAPLGGIYKQGLNIRHISVQPGTASNLHPVIALAGEGYAAMARTRTPNDYCSADPTQWPYCFRQLTNDPVKDAQNPSVPALPVVAWTSTGLDDIDLSGSRAAGRSRPIRRSATLGSTFYLADSDQGLVARGADGGWYDPVAREQPSLLNGWTSLAEVRDLAVSGPNLYALRAITSDGVDDWAVLRRGPVGPLGTNRWCIVLTSSGSMIAPSSDHSICPTPTTSNSLRTVTGMVVYAGALSDASDDRLLLLGESSGSPVNHGALVGFSNGGYGGTSMFSNCPQFGTHHRGGNPPIDRTVTVSPVDAWFPPNSAYGFAIFSDGRDNNDDLTEDDTEGLFSIDAVNSTCTKVSLQWTRGDGSTLDLFTAGNWINSPTRVLGTEWSGTNPATWTQLAIGATVDTADGKGFSSGVAIVALPARTSSTNPFNSLASYPTVLARLNHPATSRHDADGSTTDVQELQSNRIITDLAWISGSTLSPPRALVAVQAAKGQHSLDHAKPPHYYLWTADANSTNPTDGVWAPDTDFAWNDDNDPTVANSHRSLPNVSGILTYRDGYWYAGSEASLYRGTCE